MACPYLQGEYLGSCSATREVYVPSGFQLEEYCRDAKYERYRLCPFHCRAAGTAIGAAVGARTLSARRASE